MVLRGVLLPIGGGLVAWSRIVVVVVVVAVVEVVVVVFEESPALPAC